MKAFCWTLSVFASFAASLDAAGFRVNVSAFERDYENALVLANAPASFPDAGTLKGQGPEPAILPFQRDSAGNIAFVLPRLARGRTANFEVLDSAPAAGATAEARDGKVTLAVDGKTVLVYQGQAILPRPEIKPVYTRGGYIHPILSPSGKLITDDFPPNHLHHHGVWSPWTRVVFQGRATDFWNMGEGKGRVDFEGTDRRWSGPVHAGFTARHAFVDLTGGGRPTVALNETWNVTAYRVPGANYFLFDLVSTQTCSSASRVELPKYHYGGLGLRGHWDWNGANRCFFLTSNGETDRVKANETRGNWCHMGGEVDGVKTGIAVMCHPDNFRAPQGMRVHPTEPFFCYAPSQGGDWAIEPGQVYVARYRFAIKDGPPDKRQLDRLWDDYATPPRVEIVPVK